jgi:hypothetical protein
MGADNFRFLIVGAGRSGTSLLGGLLDFHPDLTVALEAYAKTCLMGHGLSGQNSDLFNVRASAFVEACKNAANRQPHKWGNKITTEQLSCLEDHNVLNPTARIDVLDAFFNNYLKNVKIIFILRDGRTCINSKVQRTGKTIEQAAKRWQYTVTCYKFFKTRHSNNVCVRFEDLLLHPKETLTEICNFLNVPYQNVMLGGTNNKKMPEAYRNSDFDLSKLEGIDLPDQILEMLRSDLEYCSYL